MEYMRSRKQNDRALVLFGKGKMAWAVFTPGLYAVTQFRFSPLKWYG